jgi:Fe-S cluster biogenesis protein NfuA
VWFKNSPAWKRGSIAQVEVIMKEKVEKVLAKIRPNLQADGGDVELVNVKAGVVTVKLTGACGGCPMATMTLKNGIERILKEEIPEVKQVVAV